MTYLDVYIRPINGGRRESPFFPRARQLWSSLIRQIESGELPGQQVDWGVWEAHLYPAEIQTIIAEYYGDPPKLQDYETAAYESLLRYVRSRDPNRRYSLVASEL